MATDTMTIQDLIDEDEARLLIVFGLAPDMPTALRIMAQDKANERTDNGQ